MNNSPAKNLVILSGPREAGKTSVCQLLVESLKPTVDLKGILSPPVFTNQIKTGINMQMIPYSLVLPLAKPKESWEYGELRWAFNDNNLDFGNQVLSKISSCDVLIIDELGPLEFEHNDGWSAAFPLIDRRAYDLCVVVIRTELLLEARQRWPFSQIMMVNQPAGIQDTFNKILQKWDEIKGS